MYTITAIEKQDLYELVVDGSQVGYFFDAQVLMNQLIDGLWAMHESASKKYAAEAILHAVIALKDGGAGTEEQMEYVKERLIDIK